MAFSHTVTKSVATPEGLVSQGATYTASGAIAIDDSVTTGTTDKLFNVAFTTADLKSVFIFSDQDVTLETNAVDHTGGDQVALKAGRPLEWQSDAGYYACPFTQNVSKMYFTNTSGATANISLRLLSDATP